jgi:methionyl-tRNA formyltransferase
MKILFFGTPYFSEIILAGLVERGFKVVGVVCQNDKPAGRGNKMTTPNVVKLARLLNIPVYQFEKLSEHIEDFKKIDYDIAVTASYGKFLPKALLDLHPCINVHPSMLPIYRGATPIQTALLNGDKLTGVTIMQTGQGMDDGDIFVQKHVEILPEDDYISLIPKLANVGLDLLCETIKNFAVGKAIKTRQDEAKATFVKLIKKEDAYLDFNDSAENLVNKVRAFCGDPVAFFFLGEDRIKVYQARVAEIEAFDGAIGQVLPTKKRFLIKTGKGIFEILKCQVQGGKVLDAKSFLNGYRFKTMVACV